MDCETEAKIETAQSTAANFIIKNLPPEIVEKIFLHLPSTDVENVCKTLPRLLQSVYFWKEFCKINEFHEVEKSLRWPAYNNYIEKFPNYWHGIYKYNKLLQHNWENNIFKFNSFSGMLYYVMYFDDHIFVATTRSHPHVSIYSSSTGELVDHNLYENQKPYLTQVKRCQDLIVFFGINYLKVWDINCKTWICNITESDSELVRNATWYPPDQFEVCNSLVAVVYYTNKLYIFNYKIKEIVLKHDDGNSVCFGDDTIAIGTKLGVIEILDFNCKPLMKLHHDEKVRIHQIKINKENLCCVTVRNDNNFMGACVWNTKQKIKLYEIKNVIHLYLSFPIIISENNFIFCKLNNPLMRNYCKIMIWNYLQGNDLITVNTGMIFDAAGLISNSRYVITHSTLNDTAKMWCKKTGKFIHNILITPDVHAMLITETRLVHRNEYYSNIIIKNYSHFE